MDHWRKGKKQQKKRTIGLLQPSLLHCSSSLHRWHIARLLELKNPARHWVIQIIKKSWNHRQTYSKRRRSCGWLTACVATGAALISWTVFCVLLKQTLHQITAPTVSVATKYSHPPWEQRALPRQNIKTPEIYYFCSQKKTKTLMTYGEIPLLQLCTKVLLLIYTEAITWR